MRTLLRHFPEHDLTVRIIRGPQTADEIIQFYKRLDRAYGHWLTYIYPAEPLDLERDVPIDRIPELKRVIAEMRRALFGDRPQFTAVVSPPDDSVEVYKFWRRYYATGENVDTSHIAFFSDLDEAYNWLGLTDAARAVATRTIEEFQASGAEPRVKAPRAERLEGPDDLRRGVESSQ